MAVLVIDRQAAMALHGRSAAVHVVVNPVVDAIELLFGFPISKWLTGFALVVAGVVVFLARRSASMGWLLLFAGVSQLVTRLVAGVLKNVFARPRPYEALAGGEWRDAFFTDGSSFPSGHAAHFWPLFFAAAIAFPRYRWLLLALAVFVSIARVVVNDHYVSDVTASAAIAAFIVYGFAGLLDRQLRKSRVTVAGE
ncbi:MAG TPA: phosphatase PAP2 family protein [Thermoanaerobaculia bacterium]